MSNKASNTLTEAILQNNSGNQSTSIIARGSPSYILYSIFDFEHGPTQIYTNAPSNMIDENFSMYLFPAKWAENAVFAFEHKGIYVLAIGVISPNITHPRGTIHTTLAIVSESIAFGKKQYDFLLESSQALHNINFNQNKSNEQHSFLRSFDFAAFFNPIYQKYDLSTPFDVLHPLYPFIKNNNVSNFFADHPESLLTIWRFRMCKMKIVFAASQLLTVATDIAYFISAMCLPFCKVDNGECAFHIDMADNEKYIGSNSNNSRSDRRPWLVCSVTHKIMQENIQGDLTIDANGFLMLRSNKDYHWLTKGHGPIIHELSNIMKNVRSDEALLRRFIDLTCNVMELSTKNTIVDESMMRSIGLDKKNANFLSYFFSTNHCNAEVGKSCC